MVYVITSGDYTYPVSNYLYSHFDNYNVKDTWERFGCQKSYALFFTYFN